MEASVAARALHIQEVCQQVVSHLCGPARQQDLLAFALTCKAFCGLALDELWSSIADLLELIKVFPKDVWVVDKDDLLVCYCEVSLVARANRTAQDFIRAPKPREWDRVLHYGAKIKTLIITEETSEDLLRQLAITRPVIHLFPNLKHLFWHSDCYTSFSYIHLFLSPKLQEFNVGSTASSQLVEYSALEVLQENCPDLRALHIETSEGHDLDRESVSALQATLCSLKNLRDLWCPSACLDSDALTWLREKQGLECLAFAYTDELESETILQDPHTFAPGFKSLKSLGITVQKSLDCVTALLRSVESPGLNSLEVTVEDIPPPGRLTDFCLSLATFCGLTQITVNMPNARSLHDPPPRIDDAVMHPLFSLAQVECLDITSSYISITGDCLRTMAKSWPRLSHLDLSPNGYQFASNASLDLVKMQDVAFLIERCQLLEWLGLHFDASPTTPEGTQWRCNQSLTCLNVYSSNIPDDLRHAARVASSLAALFPNLRLLIHDKLGSTTHVFSEDYAQRIRWEKAVTVRLRRWEQVEALFEEFKAARLQGMLESVSQNVK